MKKILLLLFVLASVTSFAQFPNYTNINGRYTWIAGKFDSTFTIPTGTTPSLRTGGANAPGAMFYRTTDSTIYQYTGTQWIKLRGGISPTDTAGLWITDLYRRNGTDSVFYVKGGSHTFAFRDSVGNAGGGGGGGKIYYFNGGVSMGTIGGLSMYELGDTANTGAAENFTRATTGNLANFITDPGKPGLLQIPAGVWTVDAYLSETGGGANHAQIWIEVEKWDGSTITTIATSPIEEITNGSVIDLYTWSVSIPTTSLAITDRIVIQFYISNTNGKTVTLYTQNGYVGEVHTTFTTGIGSLNGLTAPSQFFATGTSGTDFNIASATATHTFNLPTASATNRGALSTTDWTTFNNKIGGSGTTNYVPKFTSSSAIGNSQIFDNGTNVGIGTNSPSFKFDVYDASQTSVRFRSGASDDVSLELKNGSLQDAVFGIETSGPYLSSGGNPIYFKFTSGTKKFIFTGLGAFGVNMATTPDANLHVNGDVKINTILNATTDTDKFIVSDGGVIKYRTGSEVLSDIGGAAASSISGTTNYIPKFTSSSAIGNSVIYESGGSIGIGTTSPVNLLHLYGTDGNSYLRWTSNVATTGARIGYNGTDFRIDQQENAPIVFRINSSEQMRLTSTGLGIGTSSPTYKLVVSNSGGNGLEIDPVGATTRVDIQAYNRGTSAYSTIRLVGDVIQLYTGSSPSEKMRLDASGRLVLGATSTTRNLQVVSSGTNYWSLIGGSTNEVGLLFGISGSDAVGRIIYRNDINGLTFWTNSLERARLTSSGNFLINTTSDAGDYKLQVNGNSYFSGNVGVATTSPDTKLQVAGTGATGFSVRSNTSGDPFTRLYVDGTIYSDYYVDRATGNVNLRANTDAALIFSTGAALSERMRITSGGNVMIGTTTSGGRFTIQPTNDQVGMAISGSSLTSANAQSLIDLSQTWNTTGSPTLIKANVTNTASGASSLLMDLQVGGVSQFQVTKNGNVGIGTSPSYKLDVAGTFRTQDNTYLVETGTGSVGINTNSVNASAILEIKSTAKGFLPPRMTNAQMVAIATPEAGLVVYDTTNNKLNVYDGTNWVTLH